jgi:hypothetical protein
MFRYFFSLFLSPVDVKVFKAEDVQDADGRAFPLLRPVNGRVDLPHYPHEQSPVDAFDHRVPNVRRLRDVQQRRLATENVMHFINILDTKCPKIRGNEEFTVEQYFYKMRN